MVPQNIPWTGAARGTFTKKVGIIMDKGQADIVVSCLLARKVTLIEGSPGDQLVTDLLETLEAQL